MLPSCGGYPGEAVTGMDAERFERTTCEKADSVPKLPFLFLFLFKIFELPVHQIFFRVSIAALAVFSPDWVPML